VRDYGNRIRIWRLTEALSRYGIRAGAALNSELCDHHPEIMASSAGNRSATTKRMRCA
jgi:allantoinase